MKITRERNKETELKSPNTRTVGNIRQTFSGVINMSISCIQLKSIPKWHADRRSCWCSAAVPNYKKTLNAVQLYWYLKLRNRLQLVGWLAVSWLWTQISEISSQPDVIAKPPNIWGSCGNASHFRHTCTFSSCNRKHSIVSDVRLKTILEPH